MDRMFMMALSFSSNRLDVRGRLAAPCCRSHRPRQTTRELRVIGLGYVKWSAEQPDISAAKSRFQIVDREMPEPDTGHVGAILSWRANRCYSRMSTSTVLISSIVKPATKPRRSLSSCTVFRLHHTSIAI